MYDYFFYTNYNYICHSWLFNFSTTIFCNKANNLQFRLYRKKLVELSKNLAKNQKQLFKTWRCLTKIFKNHGFRDVQKSCLLAQPTLNSFIQPWFSSQQQQDGQNFCTLSSFFAWTCITILPCRTVFITTFGIGSGFVINSHFWKLGHSWQVWKAWWHLSQYWRSSPSPSYST